MSREPRLEEVTVEGRREKRQTRNEQFSYVNRAFVGSVNSMNNMNNMNSVSGVNGVNARVERTTVAPPTTEVYREQYCVCSRWPYTQRVLAIAVGVLLGALIGLMLSMIIKDDDNVNLPIFNTRSSAK